MANYIGYGESDYGEGPYGGYMTVEANVTLTLEEQGKLTVTVQDGTGGAISNATVSISGPESQSGSTDDNGEVVFQPISPGEYTVEASKDGFFDAATQITESDFQ